MGDEKSATTSDVLRGMKSARSRSSKAPEYKVELPTYSTGYANNARLLLLVIRITKDGFTHGRRNRTYTFILITVESASPSPRSSSPFRRRPNARAPAGPRRFDRSMPPGGSVCQWREGEGGGSKFYRIEREGV